MTRTWVLMKKVGLMVPAFVDFAAEDEFQISRAVFRIMPTTTAKELPSGRLSEDKYKPAKELPKDALDTA